MAKRPTLTDLTSLTNSSAINTLSQNWDAIQEAFDNTLSLDGSTPNAMTADLDVNGNALLNIGTIDVENLTLNGQTVTDLASVPEWRSSWLTATSYAVNDLVKINGNVYICLVAHTSGTFATDLTALKWELMVSKGDSGAGTGDMVAANNLSDVADPATARANLALGAVATDNIVPITRGGTGAITAGAALTALGAQAQDAFLDQIATLTDPNADRLLFWDDSAGAMTFLTAGTGLSITGTTLTTTGGGAWEYVWHPYNMVTEGDGNDGKFYDQTVDGTVTVFSTPNFEDGYEYRLRFYGISNSTGGAQNLRFDTFLATDLALSGVTNIITNTGASDQVSGEIVLQDVRRSRREQISFFTAALTTSAGMAGGSGGSATSVRTAQKTLYARLYWGVGSIDGGTMFLDRRKVNY